MPPNPRPVSESIMTSHDKAFQPYGARSPSPMLRRLIDLSRAMAGYGWLRPLARTMRHIAIMIIGTHPVDTEFRGIKVRLHATGNVCEKRALLSPREFDPQEFDFIEQMVEPGDICLDVGANVGLYALLCAKLTGPSGRVFAFEPHPLIFARLQANMAFNPDLSALHAENSAVYREEGQMALEEGTGNFGETRLAPEAKNAALQTRTVSLSRFLARADTAPVKLMKIDVEGFEEPILTDLFSAPSRYHPQFMIVERNEKAWPRIKTICHKAGYTSCQSTRLNEILAKHNP